MNNICQACQVFIICDLCVIVKRTYMFDSYIVSLRRQMVNHYGPWYSVVPIRHVCVFVILSCSLLLYVKTVSIWFLISDTNLNSTIQGLLRRLLGIVLTNYNNMNESGPGRRLAVADGCDFCGRKTCKAAGDERWSPRLSGQSAAAARRGARARGAGRGAGRARRRMRAAGRRAAALQCAAALRHARVSL